MHRRFLTLSALLGSVVLPACAAASDAPDSEPEETRSIVGALGTDGGAPGALAEVTAFGSNPGALKMFAYVPASKTAKPAVVVVLHGCTQGAADVAKTGWSQLADKLGFVVVYPEQNTANNSQRCFNWGGVYGDLTQIERGKDENQSIKEMVDKSVAAYGADTKRVFVAGFSAGGGQAAVMAATWPDVFAAAATIAGIPYHCNATFAEAFTCMKPGLSKTPEQWAALVKAAYPSYAGPWPRMSIWQGASDSVVAPANRTELVKQWTQIHGAGQTAAATDTVGGASHSVFKNSAGNVVVETYEVPGMDHGVAVDPSKGCGTAGSYSLDKGLCAAALVVKFFGLDTGAPAPGSSSGSTSSGSSSGTNGTNGPGGAHGSSSGATTSGGGAAKPGAPGDPGSADSTCAFRPASGNRASETGCGVAMLVAFAFAVRLRRRRSAQEPWSRS